MKNLMFLKFLHINNNIVAIRKNKPALQGQIQDFLRGGLNIEVISGAWGLGAQPPELYDIKQLIAMFQGVAPTTPLLHNWFKTSLYLLKYALNLTLGMILLLYNKISTNTSFFRLFYYISGGGS